MTQMERGGAMEEREEGEEEREELGRKDGA